MRRILFSPSGTIITHRISTVIFLTAHMKMVRIAAWRGMAIVGYKERGRDGNAMPEFPGNAVGGGMSGCRHPADDEPISFRGYLPLPQPAAVRTGLAMFAKGNLLPEPLDTGGARPPTTMRTIGLVLLTVLVMGKDGSTGTTDKRRHDRSSLQARGVGLAM